MTRVAATEFVRNFGRYRELAHRAPVAVTSHDRVTGYYMSAEDYEAYRRFRAHERQALAVEELDQATIDAIAETRMDPRHDHLNDLMK